MIYATSFWFRETRHIGRYNAVQSSQLIRAGQYNKCVQYDFKFTPVYRDGPYNSNMERVIWLHL